MKPVKITDDVYYVGVFDKDLRIFDIIMRTEHGTTYNSYLIKGEKNVLVETVKEGFADELIENISSIIDPKELDYIILNHTEPDHSGGLKKVLKAAPNAVVYGSKGACRFLKDILNEDFKHVEVRDGDELDIGGRKIRFISVPFLHWPDTMFSYLGDEQLLFTCDVYGSHYCDERVFDDLVGDFSYDYVYYYNHIMRPFKDKVIQACEKVADLDLKILCPSHGPVLRTNVRKYINEYCTLSQVDKSKKTATMVYVSAYGNTKKMAEKIKEGLEQKGVEVIMYDALHIDVNSFLDDFERADALILGSPTINGDALKPIHDIISSLATIKIKGKIGASFGSYGWSGEAVDIIYDRMRLIKFSPFEPGVKIKFIPTEQDLQSCVDFGAAIGEKINLL